MKTVLFPLALFIVGTICLNVPQNVAAQTRPQTEPKSPDVSKTTAQTTGPAAAAQKPALSDAEAHFKTLFTKATLSGRWAPLKDNELGEEKSGDKYKIVSAVKGTNDNWTIFAVMKYHDTEFPIPVPVQMKFVGETAILIVDNLGIPGGGTYSARLMIYDRTYSGTWKGQQSGGMLYGTIENEAK